MLALRLILHCVTQVKTHGESQFVFWRLGQPLLEVVEQLPPENRGTVDPSRFKFYGLAFRVDNHEAAIQCLPDGALSDVRDARQGKKRRIATLRAKPLGISPAIVFIT